MNKGVVAQMVVSGSLMGLVYALIAYGFQLTYATSKSINFGPGELVMVSTFICLTLTNLGLPYGVLGPLGLLCGSRRGRGGERAGGRRAREQKSEGWMRLTSSIGLLVVSASENS